MKLFTIKLFIPAGKASASPPIGPILGQYRLNLIEFCKDFNSKTAFWEESIILPVVIIGYSNNDFEYFIKRPTNTFFLKNIINNEIKLNNNKHIGIITLQQVYELIFHICWYSNTKNKIWNLVNIFINTAKLNGIYIIK